MVFLYNNVVNSIETKLNRCCSGILTYLFKFLDELFFISHNQIYESILVQDC